MLSVVVTKIGFFFQHFFSTNMLNIQTYIFLLKQIKCLVPVKTNQ